MAAAPTFLYFLLAVTQAFDRDEQRDVDADHQSSDLGTDDAENPTAPMGGFPPSHRLGWVDPTLQREGIDREGHLAPLVAINDAGDDGVVVPPQAVEAGASEQPENSKASGKPEKPLFNCEYAWYNVCPQHEGPYPKPQRGGGGDGSGNSDDGGSDASDEELVIRLDRVQSVWNQVGWLLQLFVGFTLCVVGVQVYVDYVKKAGEMQQETARRILCQRAPSWLRPAFECLLGVLTMACFADFVSNSHGAEKHFLFEDTRHMKWVENGTAILILSSVVVRIFSSLILAPSRRGETKCVNLLSPLLWLDLVAIFPTLFDMTPISRQDRFENLIWLRFPAMLDCLLKYNDLGEGVGVLATLVVANSNLLGLSVHLLCGAWFFFTTLHYLTERGNDEMVWGTEPGYNRYLSIPSAMYFVLVDLNGEFPNADAFSKPWGRLNSVMICFAGTYLLGIFAGVVGAAFKDHAAENKADGDASRARSRESVLEDIPQLELGSAGVADSSACLGTFILVLASVGNFIFATFLYQKPVNDDFKEGAPYGVDSWEWDMLSLCRYLEVLLAVPFFLEWVWRLCCSGQFFSYLTSMWHFFDVLSWLPGFLLFVSLTYHGSCVEYLGVATDAVAWKQLALQALCGVRLLKLDQYVGNMFSQITYVLTDNKIIFTLCLIVAVTFWLVASVLMYYAERANPDEFTRSHFETIPLSFWMTALEFSGEAPVCDHGPQGKALHAFIMLVGVGIFTVPMGLFGAAMRERLDDMHNRANSGPSSSVVGGHGRTSTSSRVTVTGEAMVGDALRRETDHQSQMQTERQQGIFRPISDTCDKYLMMLTPRTWPYKVHKTLLGTSCPGYTWQARWVQYMCVFGTLFCVFTTSIETLSFFNDCSDAEEFDTGLGIMLTPESCEPLSSVLGVIAVMCMCGFGLEFILRLMSHPMPARVIWTLSGVADIVVMCFCLPVTLGHMTGLFTCSYKQLNVLRVLRLHRLLALERFVPAFGCFADVLRIRGSQLLHVFYVVFTFWYFMSTFNWLYLHNEFEVEADDEPFAYWYSNYYYAMLYSLIHMSGDYPMTTYPVRVRLIHILSLFSAWAFVSMPAAILTSTFSDALETRRMQEQRRRTQALSKIDRLLRAAVLRSRFRRVVRDAVAEEVVKKTQLGQRRAEYQPLAELLETLENNSTYHWMLGSATVVYLVLTILRTIPELHAEVWVWDLLMFPLIVFFLLDFLARWKTAFINPEFRCSSWAYLCSLRTIARAAAFTLYFVNFIRLRFMDDDSLLVITCAAQTIFYSNIGLIVRARNLLAVVWAQARDSFLVMFYVSFTFWVLSASWWYLSEEEYRDHDLGFEDMFSALYYSGIFLLGEWCNFNFSPVGAALSMMYTFVGIGLIAMPMAVLQDTLTASVESGLIQRVEARTKQVLLNEPVTIELQSRE